MGLCDSTSNPLLRALLIAAVALTAGCFSELRSLSCSSHGDCFYREGEICENETVCRRGRFTDLTAGDGQIVLEGRVVHRGTGVSGVRVCTADAHLVTGASGETNQDGYFGFLIDEEEHTIRVSHPSYENREFEFDNSRDVTFAYVEIQACDTICIGDTGPCPQPD